jgi:hypothetical protein
MKPDPQLEKLRLAVIAAVDDLKIAEQIFQQAANAATLARTNASATATLKARAEQETASERLLELAVTAEAALEKYQAANNGWYHDSMQEASAESRALHAERLKLEEQLAALTERIAVVKAAEQPAVDKIVEENAFHSQCWSSMDQVKRKIVQQ